ncbi:MAG: hypothetical protein O7A71_04540, partial [Chloroflexi bacterium]|nr:hypothetical protein [Chloroflexota bacterium]
RHRTLTFVAIAFNPLFIIEGPVSGHNDLIMMAMLAAAAHALAIHRQRLGFLLVGLSVAVKLVTALAIPWLLIRAWQDRRNSPARSRAMAVVGLGTIALGSLLACYIPFLQTDSLLGGLGDHLARQARKPLADALIEKTPFLLCFAAATWWLIRQRRPGAWHDAWVGTSLCLILFGAGIWFPWYLTWPLALSLTRWDRPGWIASAVLLSLSAFLMLLYGFFPPGAR